MSIVQEASAAGAALYGTFTPQASKTLMPDGSIVGISDGVVTVVEPPDAGRAATYASIAPVAAKYLLPDGSIVDDLSSSGGGGGGGIETVYDKVIRTQADFVALYSSADWLGAKSVAFIGDGGTLKFTRETTGLKIPPTVKRIDGFNSAIIEITDFVYNLSTNRASLWYNTRPSTSDYSINGLSVTNIIKNEFGETKAHAFADCINLTNCYALVENNITDYWINCCGFLKCENLVNCVGLTSKNPIGEGCAFDTCTNLVNCTGKSFAMSYSRGFSQCRNLINCTGSGVSYDSTGTAFDNCTGNLNSTTI